MRGTLFSQELIDEYIARGYWEAKTIVRICGQKEE